MSFHIRGISQKESRANMKAIVVALLFIGNIRLRKN